LETPKSPVPTAPLLTTFLHLHFLGWFWFANLQCYPFSKGSCFSIFSIPLNKGKLQIPAAILQKKSIKIKAGQNLGHLTKSIPFTKEPLLRKFGQLHSFYQGHSSREA